MGAFGLEVDCMLFDIGPPSNLALLLKTRPRSYTLQHKLYDLVELAVCMKNQNQDSKYVG